MAVLFELPRLPDGLLRKLTAEPTYALETLARAAVDVHGPSAAEWAAAERRAGRRPQQSAKWVQKRFRRTARLEGGALGFGGVFTIGPDLAALVWILTREVLFVAAAYGHDPTDPARAAEMLVVLDVYDTVEEAQRGLDRQGERLAVALAKQQTERHLPGGKQRRSLTSKLIRFSSKRLARRFGGRMIPGLGAVLGSIDNAAAAKRTAADAIAFYDGR